MSPANRHSSTANQREHFHSQISNLTSIRHPHDCNLEEWPGNVHDRLARRKKGGHTSLGLSSKTAFAVRKDRYPSVSPMAGAQKMDGLSIWDAMALYDVQKYNQEEM